jgi:hypothetical protein
MMIDQADRELQAWVQGLLPEVEVRLGFSSDFKGKKGVSLYLLALAEPLPAWVSRQTAQSIALRYLVTTWAANEAEAHALLGKLAFAALEKREYELNLAELPATLWSAFSIAPRPAFTLWVPCFMELPAPTISLVRGPLVVRGTPIRSFHGIVVGPGEIPIMGASIELPTLQLRGHTDPQGRFFFSTIPAEPHVFQMVVKAKGHVQNVTVEQPASDKDPFIVRFDSFDTK